MTRLEELAFMFMEMSEKWVQGSAFLGMMTQEEYDAHYIDENGEVKVYEERNKAKYIKLLSEYIGEFVNFKLQEYGKA